MVHRTRSLLLLVSALVLPAAAAAVPPRAGGEFPVNTYTTSAQLAADAAADDRGRFVVVWQSDLADGSEEGIFARRYRADGIAVNGEFQVNTFTTASQFGPRLAVNGAGRMVVVWTSEGGQDGSGQGVFGQIYNAAGSAVSGEFQVNAYTTGDQAAPAVAMDAAGNVVAVWASDDQSSLGIQARRFGSTGAPLGGEFAVNTTTLATQSQPAVAAHEDGSFVVTWTSLFQDGSAAGVFGRRFDAAGAPLGGEFAVNTHTPQSQEGSRVAALGGGAFAVVWQSALQDGSGRGVYTRRFDSAGNPGAVFAANTYTFDSQQAPAVAADGSGGFTVVWESWSQDGSLSAVAGRSFGASGAPAGDEFRVNTYTPGAQGVPAVAGDPGGRFVVAWQGDYQDGSLQGIRAQRYGDLIFADGLESGGLSAWSSSVTDGGDLTVSAAAALAGSALGLRGVVDDVSSVYVQDDAPSDESRYRARFYLDPNGFDPGESQLQRRTRTFIAFSESPNRRVAAIVLRRQNGVYALMGRARLDDNSQADTGFFTIGDGPHAVEIDLVRASGPDALDGSFELWIDGVSMIHLSALDNSEAEVDFARLGALSVKPAASGTLYWDEFESRRESPVGLVP